MRKHMLQHKTTRRRFLKHSTALAAAWWVAGYETTGHARSPNQKLNIGVIGCGGRGFADLQGCATENMKWYDAGKVPLQELADGQPLPHSGSLLIGDEGTMYVPDAWGRKWKLLPEEKFADYKPPEPTIRRAGDPYIEWIAACKGGPPALSQFDYSAVLTETVLLGIVAVRVGKRIEWDAENMKARSTPEAEAFVKREYRKGWTL